MARMLVLMNHKLTGCQKREAAGKFKIDGFELPPERVSRYWADVPPKGALSGEGLKRTEAWVLKTAVPGDYLLVQGEFGAAFYIVDLCFQNGIVPVYATTKRDSKEVRQKNGAVIRNQVFRHVTLRKYLRYGVRGNE